MYPPILIGAGHNGLTTAFYLAKAGMRPLVLERREVVGGAAVTEAIAPGIAARWRTRRDRCATRLFATCSCRDESSSFAPIPA